LTVVMASTRACGWASAIRIACASSMPGSVSITSRSMTDSSGASGFGQPLQQGGVGVFEVAACLGKVQGRPPVVAKHPVAVHHDIADVLASTPMPGEIFAHGRGGGTVASVFAMVNSTVRSHSQAWPVGTHSKFHRHGPGIHVVLLRGEGYSLMGLDSSHPDRIDWQPGSMFVPPENWWHGHYNTSEDPALFLAIGWGSDKPKAGGKQYVYKPVRDGGDQFEFDEEDPAIHHLFEDELAKHGVKCRMGTIHPHCRQK